MIMKSEPVPALYEMEPIGIDGHLEAVATLWFCSEGCREAYLSHTEQLVVVASGEDSDYWDGICCEECGLPV